jgi:hypothetical protein
MEVERHGKKFLRSPAGKILYPVIILRPNINNLGLYKAQIRWFKNLEYWFRNTGDDFLSKEYKELAECLQKKLRSMAR